MIRHPFANDGPSVMLRLTALLVVALYAVMVIWGESSESDVVVTRAAGLDGPLMGVAAASADVAPDRADATELSQLSAAEAVQIALAAGEVDPAERPDREPRMSDLAPAPEPEWFVTGSAVNLRAGPSTRDAIIGRAGLGDRAEVVSDPSDEWIRIRTEGGLEAYIFGRFLAAENPA